jgi:hypothetical protein
MIPERLQQLERELRAAAAARLYPEVRRLATEFCSVAAAYASALPAEDPRVANAAAKVDEVLNWSILMMQLARSACSSELQRIRTTRQYLMDASPKL